MAARRTALYKFKALTLYALVWTYPRTELARHFKISSVMLTRDLKKLKIKLPTNAHWATNTEGTRYPVLSDDDLKELFELKVPDDFDVSRLEADPKFIEVQALLFRRNEDQFLTRGQLHKLVWSLPAEVLASDLSVSIYALREALKKHAIPHPSGADWANYRQHRTRLRRTRLSDNPELPALVVPTRTVLDIDALIDESVATDYVPLEVSAIPAPVESVVGEWWENRTDKARVSQAAVVKGLELFGRLDDDRAALIRYFSSLPRPPGSTLRRDIKGRLPKGSPHSGEIVGSLLSISTYYRTQESTLVSASVRAVAEAGRRRDKLSEGQRAERVRTFLSWFENQSADKDWTIYRDHCLFALMVRLQLSANALLRCQEHDLNLFQGTLMCTDKQGGKQRTIHLPEDVIVLLYRYGSKKPSNRNGDASLFINNRYTALQRQGLDRAFNERIAQSGMAPELLLSSLKIAAKGKRARSRV